MTTVRIVMLVLLFAGPAVAGGSLKDGQGEGAFAGPIFVRGCYWHRGERYCSTYCYQEINGNRYCNTRESEAVPQGDPYKPVLPTVEDIYRPRRD